MRIKAEPTFIMTLFILFALNDLKTVALMLLSATAHELGHILVLTLFGVRIRALVLGFFGGTLVLEKKMVSYTKDAVIAMSGGLVNLLLALVLFFVLRQGFSSDVFFFFLTNLFYGIFNLLPIATLDGGMALKALLATKKELDDAERTVQTVSRVTLLFLAFISLYLVTLSAFNISLLLVTLLFYAESSRGHIISGYEFCRRTS